MEDIILKICAFFQGMEILILDDFENGLAFCLNNNTIFHIVVNNEITHIINPQFFDGKESVCRLGECPPIYIGEYKNAYLYSGTSLISVESIGISDSAVINKFEKRFALENDRWIKTKKYKEAVLEYYASENKTYEEGISLVGNVATNYYHFCILILPKLIIADLFEEYRHLPIFVDEGVLNIPQLTDILNIVNVNNHEIIPVHSKTRVLVRNLVNCSELSGMPFNYKMGEEHKYTDFWFSSNGIKKMRELVLSHVPNIDFVEGKKIFLARKNNDNVRLINQEELIGFLRQQGFSIIYPEELSFSRQVNMFRNAEVIIGTAGGSFTNVIWCKPSTYIGIIALDVDQYCFANIAYMFNVEIEVLEASLIDKGWSDSVNKFCMPVEKMVRVMEKLEVRNQSGQ